MDAFTLVVTYALAGAIMARTLGLLYLAGSRQRCLLDWALAGVFFTCSSLLGAAAARFQISHLLVPGLGNAFYVAGHFGILAGLRRHLGLAPGWKLLAPWGGLILALHLLPAVHDSVTTRLLLFTPMIAGLNLSVAFTVWRRVERGARAAYLPLAVLELLFMLQLSARTIYLVASENHTLTFMGSQFLQTSGSLFVMVFLSVATMSCALIVTHQQSQALRRASLTDVLTGCLNRRALQDQAGALFQRPPAERGRPNTMYFIAFDIDHFKAINDLHGHAVGDAAICHVTRLTRGVLRGQDALFRLGGEEFAVLIAGGRIEGVCAVAERLRELVAATPLQAGELTVSMTISVGVAQRETGDGKWDDILRRADDALYFAKQNGRNRLGVHGRDLGMRARAAA